MSEKKEKKTEKKAEETKAVSPAKKPGKNKKKLIILVSSICAAIIALTVVLIIIFVPKGQDADADADADIPGSGVIDAANHFTGVVEPQQMLNISKDPSRTVKEVYVNVGDVVQKGAKLFAYETSDISEKLENAKLELASGKNEIDRLANDINNLTAQRSQAKTESEQLDLTAQIQTAQTQKERAELELKKKQAEIETLNNNLNNSVVTANISGIVNHVGAVGSQSVQEGGNSGNEGVDSSGAFITLLMSGTFRVKGTVDEMNVGSLSEGMNVTVHSRMDDTKTWTGSIAKIETNSPSSGNENQAGGGQAAEGATKYYFYVNLASSDGLLLGQHVYIEPGIQWDTEDSTDSSASVPGTTAVAAN